MQFALESYLIPPEIILPNESDIAIEMMRRPHIFQMIGRGIQALIGLLGRLVSILGQAISRIRGKRVEEYDDYEEEWVEEDGPKEWVLDTWNRLDRVCSSARSVTNDLRSLVTTLEDPNSGNKELARNRSGKSISERDAFGSIRSSQVWENLKNFATRTSEFKKIPSEKLWITHSDQQSVINFLETEREAAQKMQARLEKYYDGYSTGKSEVDNENIQDLPLLTKAITEYSQISMDFVRVVQMCHILSE